MKNTKSNKKTPFTHSKKIYKSNTKFDGDEGYSQYIINKEISKNLTKIILLYFLIFLTNFLEVFTSDNEINKIKAIIER